MIYILFNYIHISLFHFQYTNLLLTGFEVYGRIKKNLALKAEYKSQIILPSGKSNIKYLFIIHVYPENNVSRITKHSMKHVIIVYYLLIKNCIMDFEFFGGSTTGQTSFQQEYGRQHFESQDNAPDDQFQFADPSKYVSIETVQQPNYPVYEPDNQCLRKVQQEQERIQDILRKKADVEYEQKQRRREEGKRQYQEFVEKKYNETVNRKQENKEKQKKILQNNLKISHQAGWKKVAINVPLKQGEHKGAKDITRMRQSIINKKNDQSQ